MKHELINILKFPSMPALMDSEDEGEAWIWGDYVATFQKNPRISGALVNESIDRLSGIKSKTPSKQSHIEYPYAMNVFYKKHLNPHGPSSRPIVCVGIEQANYGALNNLIGGLSEAGLSADSKGPLMVGIFMHTMRRNLGVFDDLLSRDNARSKFFEIIKSELNPEGVAKHIGGIRDIYGHSETGWSPLQKKPEFKESRKTGCLGIFLIMIIIVPVIFNTIFFRR